MDKPPSPHHPRRARCIAGEDRGPRRQLREASDATLVPSRVERQFHVQEKLRCRCGETILLAEGPPKVFDKTRFGPNFMAQVLVSKCADSTLLYRQRAALDAGLLGAPQHLAMRQARSKPVMEEFKAWLEAEQPRHPPKSAIGSAISLAPGWRFLIAPPGNEDVWEDDSLLRI